MHAQKKVFYNLHTSDLDIHILREHDILTLEISVDDIKRVAKGNATAHLTKDEPGLGLVEVATGVDVVQEIAILG